MEEAEEIMEMNGVEEFMLALPHHERENLPLRLKMAGAYLAGAAAGGDLDRLQYYLEKYTHGIKGRCRFFLLVMERRYLFSIDPSPGKEK